MPHTELDMLSRILRSDTVRLRTATIASFASNRATVTLAGATVTGVPYLSSYTPVVGHVVLMLQAANRHVIIGKVA